MPNLLSFLNEGIIEAGCDEAGRGCLAGPVVAAAVILPRGFYHPFLNDSKQVTEKKREELRIIIEKESVSWGIGIVDNNEIDKINILNASFLAMHRAVDKLKITPDHLLIDGNRFKQYRSIPYSCVIKGDGKYLSIAAASILAKTHRDEMMINLHDSFPFYNWKKNKGYPTKDHRKAIKDHGLTLLHRRSFRLLDDQLSLF
ncbi:MAG: ribonuclease HII [Marinilabiliaceae bacterium]|nr:ribonuclease HII [Marinilabiliaceae bacterium]